VPRAPLFAVPCPTTLFTAALLLTAVRPAPVLVFVVPVMWATLAGTAAIALGVTPDLMLFVAAICLIVYVARSLIVRVRDPAALVNVAKMPGAR